jgi:hypothetical protein
MSFFAEKAEEKNCQRSSKESEGKAGKARGQEGGKTRKQI